jgi:glycopeptide antibiotics resistance protein
MIVTMMPAMMSAMVPAMGARHDARHGARRDAPHDAHRDVRRDAHRTHLHSSYYSSYQSINLVPFSTISFYLSGEANGLVSFFNLAANIALFIPFGIFLKMKERSIFQLVYIPILFISLIELLQYFTLRGSLDIDDFILNVLGFFIGYLVYPLFTKILKVSLQK